MFPISQKIITGIDDATKCPCIGSIFIAGVVADEDTVMRWKEIGVKDSKLIAPKKMQNLALTIKETAIAYAIDEMTPQMIDNKCFNLNDWEMLTVLKILQKLQRSTRLDKIYIDNWETSRKGFFQRYKTLMQYKLRKKLVEYNIRLNRKKINSLELIPEHRADENYTIVGAASILAKTSSDIQYSTYKKQYGNFGSGSPGDPQTRLFVWQHRHNPPPIVRTSWNTYKTLALLDAIEDDPLYRRIRKKQEIAN